MIKDRNSKQTGFIKCADNYHSIQLSEFFSMICFLPVFNIDALNIAQEIALEEIL